MEKSWSDKIRGGMRYLLARWPVLVHDGLTVPIAWLGAYWFRFNLGEIPDIFLAQALAMLPIVFFWHFVFFVVFGVHRGAWRFTSTHDLETILKSVLVGTAFVAFSIFLATRLIAVPRSVFPLHGLFLIALLMSTRVLYRLFRDRQVRRGQGKRILIIGAGEAGDMLLKDIRRNRNLNYEIVGFIDDDPTKKGSKIQGVKVLDRCAALPQLVLLLKVELILIAIPSASGAEMRTLVESCETARTPFRTLPKTKDILDGSALSNDLRSVELDDLLGREKVDLDWKNMEILVKNQVILITGGGGSIGSELCRQVVKLKPSRVILVEQNEFNLYSLSRELEEKIPYTDVSTILADVCDPVAVDHIFSKYRPDIVFHAAAYKHVPMLQNQIRETIKNNTLGTLNVAQISVKFKVKKMVLISTDKAVNPSSMMGVSKRLAEMTLQLLNQEHETTFITVRFGNVLGSAGSVVPLFQHQIRSGGPVTVTDPQMTRYFMTISEACQLILQACVIGDGGEIFVLNMGEPVQIDYLARQMIRLSGKIPDDEISIKYTGLRPGEKLTEELFHSEENLSETTADKILLAKARSFNREQFKNGIEKLQAACERYEEESIEDISTDLVPEFRSSLEDNGAMSSVA